MILVDSSGLDRVSAGHRQPAHLGVRAALEQGGALASTDVIVMEILASARDNDDRDRLRRLL